MCYGLAQAVFTFALTKTKAMNTENTLAGISAIISSEASFKTMENEKVKYLIDMINEMDLELMDISMC